MFSNFGWKVLSLVLVLLNSSQNGATAQTNSTSGTITVYSTFIYARTGERTPLLGLENEELDSTQLTAFGAQQMYNAGNFYRQRYIGTGSDAAHRVFALEPNVLDDVQLNVQSPMADFTVKSAQAFMQGFYPPVTNQNGNATSGQQNLMADGRYVDAPLGGYQYPLIQSFSAWSPESIFINGNDNCANGDLGRIGVTGSDQFQQMVRLTRTLYRAVSPLFQGTLALPLGVNWTYNYANSISEYLEYENRHNATVNAAFKAGGSYAGMLSSFVDISTMKMWQFYGDKTVTAGGTQPGDTILAMGGRTLAANIIAQLDSNINSFGLVNKFNLVTGEFQNMISLFSLLGLGELNSPLRIVPGYGSSIAFEVFTYQSGGSTPTIPDPKNLWVRFLFRNASDPYSSDPVKVMPGIQSYPIFNRGPSGSDMPYLEFRDAMRKISTGYISEWCTKCNADTLYCYPFLNSTSTSGNGNRRGSSSSTLSPAVGGVIGAVVTLLVAGLIFGLAALFGGIRVYRKENTKKSLGGFKGSNKMASDADLNLPKNAEPPSGISFDNATPKKAHERVGSWELKPAGEDHTPFGAHARFASIGSTVVGRSSFDSEHDGELTAPVSPRESV